MTEVSWIQSCFHWFFFVTFLILMETFEDGPLGNLDWILVVKEFSLTMLKHHLRSDEVIPCLLMWL